MVRNTGQLDVSSLMVGISLILSLTGASPGYSQSTWEDQPRTKKGEPQIKDGAKKPADTSSQSEFAEPRHASGRYQVVIPPDIESMWVFYQSKSVRSPSGCQRPPNADPITPKAFTERIDEFIKHASANKGIALIFTAFSQERGWDAAASEIRINGEALKPMTSYWCNGVHNYGYELELR